MESCPSQKAAEIRRSKPCWGAVASRPLLEPSFLDSLLNLTLNSIFKKLSHLAMVLRICPLLSEEISSTVNPYRYLHQLASYSEKG